MAAQMVDMRPGSDGQRRRNLRTALILVSLALAFFAGIVLKYLVFP